MYLRLCTLTLLCWISVTILVIKGMPNDCKDNIKNCRLYASGSCNGKYKPWAMKNCRLTCNLCQEDLTKPQVECKDFSTYCAKNENKYKLCNAEHYRFNGNRYAEANCRKYCGLCDPNEKYTGPKSDKKSCTDKRTKKVYEHQMKWRDGCRMCDCEDGSTMCVNVPCRGPRYPSCKPIVPQKPGACCTEYECPKSNEK